MPLDQAPSAGASSTGRGRGLAAAVLSALVAISPMAQASDLTASSAPRAVAYPPPPTGSGSFVNEFRVGGYYHGFGNPERNTADVNVEFLTREIWFPKDPAYSWLAPRLHVGGTINTGGRTSYGYAGLTWTWNNTYFFQESAFARRFFAEFSFGGSVNDGYTGNYAPFTHAKLGCAALFRESGSVGYRITENLSIMATIEHVSNGGLCDYNRGINTAGVRLGLSF